jgi:hypothetical protein
MDIAGVRSPLLRRFAVLPEVVNVKLIPALLVQRDDDWPVHPSREYRIRSVIARVAAAEPHFEKGVIGCFAPYFQGAASLAVAANLQCIRIGRGEDNAGWPMGWFVVFHIDPRSPGGSG